MTPLMGVGEAAARVGIPLMIDPKQPGDDPEFAWTGKALTLYKWNPFYVHDPEAAHEMRLSYSPGLRDIGSLYHDIAHYQLAAPHRRGRGNFGLNVYNGYREEQLASILGIAWEHYYCGWKRAQERLKAFDWIYGHRIWNDQLWELLHVLDVVLWLEANGYLKHGQPTNKVRQRGDALPAHATHLPVA